MDSACGPRTAVERRKGSWPGLGACGKSRIPTSYWWKIRMCCWPRCRAESGRSSAASHAAVGAWASYQGYIVITSVAVRAHIGKSAERGHHDLAGP